MTNVIARFEKEYGFLSNFWLSPITMDWLGGDPLRFPSGEHAFQAAKALAMPLRRSAKDLYLRGVQKAETPSNAKYLGRSVKVDIDSWNSMRVDCMRKVVWEKFYSDLDLREQLLATGHALLVEGNTWGDTFWGRCEGKGSNILGSILMEVRGFWLWTVAGKGS